MMNECSVSDILHFSRTTVEVYERNIREKLNGCCHEVRYPLTKKTYTFSWSLQTSRLNVHYIFLIISLFHQLFSYFSGSGLTRTWWWGVMTVTFTFWFWDDLVGHCLLKVEVFSDVELLQDVYFDDESAEVVISSLRLGDDQER